MRGTACTVGSDAVRMPFSFILLNMPLSADCSLDDSETGFRSWCEDSQDAITDITCIYDWC